jgi:uncharacterized protein (TIGR02453 family)
MLQTATLKFLKDLKKNNNRPWFEAHRTDYEQAKADFAGLIDAVIKKHGKKDKTISHLQPKDCMFRINRDVRFSKDKSPYKSNMGAYLNRGGKKSLFGGYYFHCEPGKSFVGGGLWMPMPAELHKIRQEIDYNLADFRKIVESRRFKSIYNTVSRDAEYTLSRVPKGYEADNPAAEYLKLKSVVATASVPDGVLTSKELVGTIAKAFEALQPMIEFVNDAIG